jgi:AcrR family transcriptional regulator
MSAPRGEAARQRIVRAARELILEGGLDAFTVEAVAAASGAARSTIYRHWPEPHDLLVDTLGSMGRDLPIPDTGGLATDIESCAAMLRLMLDDPRTKRLLLDVTRLAADDPGLERVLQRLIQERRQPIQVILQRAIRRGETDADIDMAEAMHLVEGPLMSAMVMHNLQMTDEAVHSMVERIVKALS